MSFFKWMPYFDVYKHMHNCFWTSIKSNKDIEMLNVVAEVPEISQNAYSILGEDTNLCFFLNK